MCTLRLPLPVMLSAVVVSCLSLFGCGGGDESAGQRQLEPLAIVGNVEGGLDMSSTTGKSSAEIGEPVALDIQPAPVDALEAAAPAVDSVQTQARIAAAQVIADTGSPAMLAQSPADSATAVWQADTAPPAALPQSIEPVVVADAAPDVQPSTDGSAAVWQAAAAPESAEPGIAKAARVEQPSMDASGTTSRIVLPGTGVSRNSSGCAATEFDDFVDTTDWALRRLLPRDCLIVRDNPVSFSWTQPPDRDLSQPWTLAITTLAGASVRSQSVASPRLTLATPLPVGKYRWQVTYRSKKGDLRISAWRRFEVDATTLTYALPTAAQLAAIVRTRTSPRVLPNGKTWQDILNAAQSPNYKDAYTGLIRTAEASLKAPLPVSPDSRTRESFATYEDYTKWMLPIGNLTRDEQKVIESLSYAWRLTGKTAYLDAAKKRLLHFAAWNVNGGTSEANQPIGNRGVYMALAIGFDLLGSSLNPSERALIASACEARISQAVKTLDTLDFAPYPTFPNNTIQYSLQALLLVAGLPEFPKSLDLLQKVWPYYTAAFQAQGGEDGGVAGSVSYAWYDFYSMSRTMATLLLVADVNMTTSGFPRRMGDYFLAMTTPNEIQFNSFGDGLEVSSLFKNYAFDAFRLYAAITRNANYEWYWKQESPSIHQFSYITPLHFLIAAHMGAQIAPIAPDRLDFTFADVGLSSFNIGVNSERSSLQFESSRFGSYTHSHADQNSFTFSSHGTNLLINSGYYPYYMSPHHSTDTRATRYSNNVTFDGGIGQAEAVADPRAPTRPMTTMQARGKLINSYSTPGLAVATGDATLAYRGWNASKYTWQPLLSNAVRSIAYLKSERIVLVYDWLTSDTPRQWEWNYHAMAPFTVAGSTVKVVNGAAMACMSYHGVTGNISTRAGFDISPEKEMPQQYHVLYRASGKSNSTAMVTVIREDCNSTPVSVKLAGTSAEVTVGSKNLIFDKRTVMLPTGLPAN